MTRQTWTALVSGAIFVVLAAIIALAPVPFVAWAPGATYDVLGRQNDKPVIEISGEATHQPTGTLRMTTVAMTSVDSHLSLPEAVLSYWRPFRDVLPRDFIYPVGEPVDVIRARDAARMATSQRAAIVAGLQAAGKPVTQVPQITSVVVSGPSYNRLQVGDFIEAVDGVPVTSRVDVENAIRRHTIGDLIQIDIERAGSKLKVSVTTVASNDDQPVPRIGIEMINGYRFEPTITFNVADSVSGSSAGLAFALGVYDLLTTDDLIAGRHIAATGEITADGTVNSIGAVPEKVRAAKDAGASIILVPAGNCSDLLDPVTGIRVVKVTHLTDAISSLAALSADPFNPEVPSCE